MRRLVFVCAALAVTGTTAAQAGDSGSITGRVLANPLSVVVNVPDSPIKRGRWFRVAVHVENAGSTPLATVGVTLVRDPALMLRPAAPSQTIPSIPAGGGRKVVWEACSNTPASYVVLARAATGPFMAESPGVLVQIAPTNRTC